MDEELIRRLYQELRPMARNLARQYPYLYDEEDFLQVAVAGVAFDVQHGTCLEKMSHMVHLAKFLMLRCLERNEPTLSLDAYLYNEQTGRRREIAAVEPESTITLSETQRRYVKFMLKMSNPRQRAILLASFGLPHPRSGHHWTVKGVCRRYRLDRWHFDQLQATLVRKWRVQSPIS